VRPALFDHDRLEVYQVARQFKRQLQGLLPLIPRGNANLVDQLKRAARSITNNILSVDWMPHNAIGFLLRAHPGAQKTFRICTS